MMHRLSSRPCRVVREIALSGFNTPNSGTEIAEEGRNAEAVEHHGCGHVKTIRRRAGN
jgi:hypothetical protein